MRIDNNYFYQFTILLIFAICSFRSINKIFEENQMISTQINDIKSKYHHLCEVVKTMQDRIENLEKIESTRLRKEKEQQKFGYTIYLSRANRHARKRPFTERNGVMKKYISVLNIWN